MSADIGWQAEAACTSQHELFDPPPFGDTTLRAHRQRHQTALNICRNQCSVQPECLTWALHHYADDMAIIGGTTGWQRQQIRRQHGIQRPTVQLMSACGHTTTDGTCSCRKATIR